MKPVLNQKDGSAYLAVLATIVVAMFLLVASMQRSVDSSKQTFSIENHTITNNSINSCITYIFHHVKTWPFDSKAELILPDNKVTFGESSCTFKLLNSDLLNFDFEVRAQYKKLEKVKLLTVSGKESDRGIQWEYSIQ